MNYNRIKKNYQTNLFTKRMVRSAYNVGIINLAEYYSIVKSIEDSDIPENMERGEFEEYLKDVCIKAGIWQ